MADNLNFLQIRSPADHPPTKNYTLIHRTSTSFMEQQQSREESLIAQWLALVNKAQLGGYFLGILGFIMCITSTGIECWRVWRVESEDGRNPSVVWIGIWKACYVHSTPSENGHVQCEKFTERMTMLPKEIFLAQDLMSLSCVLGAGSMTIMSFSLGVAVKDGQKKNIFTLFTLGGLLNFVVGIMVLVPVFWNLSSILENRDIQFPKSFDIPLGPKHQEVGASIYVGYSAAVLFLSSGVMIICNKSVLQKVAKNQVSPPANESVTTRFRSNFSSSVIINVINRDEPKPGARESTHVYFADIDRDSSHSIQPQLLDNAKNVPIISVTPFQ